MQHLTVLGSTGSIGTSTLDVVTRHPDKFSIVALTANSQVELLFRQCQQFKPAYAVMLDEVAAIQLRQRVREAGLGTEVLSGVAALEQVVVLPEVDAVMAAIVGAAGLRPTLAAAHAGKKILLANKETLVMEGTCSWMRYAPAVPRCCRSTASITRSSRPCRAVITVIWRVMVCAASC